MDGLLTAVFDAFALKEQPEQLLAEGDALPLFFDPWSKCGDAFCDHTYHVTSDEEKARRVWAGLEKKLTCEALRLISVSWLSELQELNTPLFRYICKVFRQGDISRNFADADVLAVTNIARRVLHEQLRMKQFIRFQKAKDGTYLGVVSPDHNVLPIITDHFQDRFNDQLFQDLWRTYFKAICIKERMNPRKQLQDMPRRYWKYMTEKN